MSSDRRRFNGRERIALYLAQGGYCAKCGIELTSSWHADHIEPWSRGGETDVINGQALCPTCNLKKGDRIQVESKKPLRKWQQEALERYDQHQGKTFLVEACPAAGKTRFIAEVVARELHKGKADAIVVVVPSAALRTQMADDFNAETGIQLDPKWNGDGVPLIHGEYKGAVVTYQWLASNSSLMRKWVSRQFTLIVLDEVHHAQDEKAWGEALLDAFGQVKTRILLTTGTPFTTEGNPIVFVNYDVETGLALADYSINYGRAITEEEEPIVRTIVFDHHQGEMVWDSEDGIRTATFDDKLNKRDIGRRLRTAIHEDKEHIGALLRRGIHRLRELRENDPDAAMLVVAQDQMHAKKLAKRIQQEFGITPIVAISEDGDAAAGKIKAFKNSDEPCIIAVDMISEGVNIPRIRVIVYATNVTTYLYFTQVLGRAMRIESGHTDHTAHIFTPDDERFRAFAAKIMKECEEALAKHDEKRTPSDKPDQDSFLFNPMSASFTNVVAMLNGVPINADELAIAGTLKASNPQLKGAGFSMQHIVLMMKAIGFDFTSARPQENHSSTQEAPQAEKPLYERLSDLRKDNNKLVKRLYFSRKGEVEFADINIRLNATVGIRTVEKCFDPDKLQRRYDFAKRWLTKGIEPEAPFND